MRCIVGGRVVTITTKGENAACRSSKESKLELERNAFNDKFKAVLSVDPAFDHQGGKGEMAVGVIIIVMTSH